MNRRPKVIDMPQNRPISATIPHNLGQEEARRRIAEGFSSLQRNSSAGPGSLLAIQERWERNRLYFEAVGLGQKISGRLDVLPMSVQIEIDMPDMLALVAERILSVLKIGTQKLLE